VLVHHWESADGRKKMAQVLVSQTKVDEVLTELHSCTSGGHLGPNKTMDRVRQCYYWLRLRDDVGRWCRQCDACAASRGPRTRNRGLMHQYNVGAPFESPLTSPGLSRRATGKPIPSGRHGLPYKVARSLRHSEPVGIERSRSLGEQLLLSFWCPDGATQCPGAEL
jgi:hypothetical protein